MDPLKNPFQAPPALDQTVRQPNPEDWTDLEGVVELLAASRSTVYHLIRKGILTRYYVGASPTPLFWLAEVREIWNARKRLGGKS